MAKKKSFGVIIGAVVGLLAVVGAAFGITTAVKQASCEHVWSDGEIKVEATCDKEGKIVYKCEECGKRETEKIETLAHTWKFVEAKAPTCTEKGHTEYTYCEACEEYKNDVEPQVLLALGHTEIKIEGYAATCMEAGLKDGKYCTTCEEITVEQKIIPALGHKIVKVAAKEPTCTQPGNTSGQKCATCGVVYVGCEEIPLLGHQEGDDDYCDNCGLWLEYTAIDDGALYTKSELQSEGIDTENLCIFLSYSPSNPDLMDSMVVIWLDEGCSIGYAFEEDLSFFVVKKDGSGDVSIVEPINTEDIEGITVYCPEIIDLDNFYLCQVYVSPTLNWYGVQIVENGDIHFRVLEEK